MKPAIRTAWFMCLV